MKKRKLALLLAGVLTAASVLTACGSKNGSNQPAESGAPAASGNGTTLTVCVGPEPDTIDPALNSAVDGGTLIDHAFEGLMRLSKDGVTYEEGLTEKYEISEDQLTYTFTLRDGLKWSDGSDLTANDFVYSWNRAIAPETAADYAYMFECIEGYADGKLNITAVDDKTFEVKLIAITPYFLELCAFPAYLPVQQAAVEAGGDAWATDPSTYVCNGPYKL
ncbi:MAG: peptide ABC transporter substrate-binding protein, partial [Acetivibrio ethanolgignens]